MVQRVAFGTAPQGAHLFDLNFREMATFVPLVVLVFWIGLFPNPMLTRMHASVNQLVEQAEPAAPSAQARGERREARGDEPEIAPGSTHRDPRMVLFDESQPLALRPSPRAWEHR
jgi:NADH-quinone oxidoreductase subunit M